jgi:hypothetical protein
MRNIFFQPISGVKFLLGEMLHIPNFILKSWFLYDFSQSHESYYFGKCVTNSWEDDKSFGNQLLEQKFGMFSFSLLLKYIKRFYFIDLVIIDCNLL